MIPQCKSMPRVIVISLLGASVLSLGSLADHLGHEKEAMPREVNAQQLCSADRAQANAPVMVL